MSSWLNARLTGHDDIGESQFACDGHPPADNERVLPADLLHVASQQLQRDDETCTGRRGRGTTDGGREERG